MYIIDFLYIFPGLSHHLLFEIECLVLMLNKHPELRGQIPVLHRMSSEGSGCKITHYIKKEISSDY